MKFHTLGVFDFPAGCILEIFIIRAHVCAPRCRFAFSSPFYRFTTLYVCVCVSILHLCSSLSLQGCLTIRADTMYEILDHFGQLCLINFQIGTNVFFLPAVGHFFWDEEVFFRLFLCIVISVCVFWGPPRLQSHCPISVSVFCFALSVISSWLVHAKRREKQQKRLTVTTTVAYRSIKSTFRCPPSHSQTPVNATG